MLTKKAIITGIGGQDGQSLATLLHSKSYFIIGTTHKDITCKTKSVAIEGSHHIHLDLNDVVSIHALVEEHQPQEIYNLAARSSSAQLFDDPLATADINGLAAVRFLEAIRQVSPRTRFCQAASSEVFAGSCDSPQDEMTPMRPINAYGAAKTYAANMVSAYRMNYGLYATTAFLFNHESPRRSLDYVTRKITHTVAKISLGLADELKLGSLDSRRDWGYADDYARAMWLMLQQPEPEDFVIATGITHSVREFCEVAFSHVGLDYRKFVRTDAQLIRRPETIELRGNSAHAHQCLGWLPSIGFTDLVCMMVDADLAQLKQAIAR